MSTFHSAFRALHSALGSWLPDMDLNLVLRCFRHYS